MIQRKKRNSSKINLVFSIVFHGLLFGVLFYFAAREGLVGKKMQALTATLVPKVKPPEPPKEKPPEPKVETPKVAQTPKSVTAPPKMQTAPPPSDVAPSVAPAQVNLPSFAFNDGAHDVQSISDPVEVYKSIIEHSIRANWKRQENIDDTNFKAEVEMNIDAKGRVVDSRWLTGSGNAAWDESVKSAVAQTTAINQAPPKGFPGKFIVRFDVSTIAAENALEFGGL